MHDHHRRAIEAVLPRLAQDQSLQLVLLGGSIAKGIERPDSDVDLIAIVSEEAFEERLRTNRASFLFTEEAEWENGYVEGRYLSCGFILAAAERGSEPTRHSFTGVRPVWGSDPELEAAIQRIPVYPEHEREAKMLAFHAQMALWRRYFWPEAERMGDPVLKARSATEVVLFGVRLVLAHNRVLFPCAKRLMEALARCREQPQGLQELAKSVVERLDAGAKEAFCEAVIGLVGQPEGDLVSRFEMDIEMSWFTRSHAVAEW